MTKVLATCLFLGWCLTATVAISADKEDAFLDQKKELEQIQKEVEDRQRKLDSLKQVELQVQKKVSEYDQRIASNRKLIGRLNRQLSQLKKNIAETERLLEANERNLDRLRRRFLGNIRQFYLAAKNPHQVISEDPNEELELIRQIIYLTTLASFESGNVAQAKRYLVQTQDQLAHLTGEKKEVYRLKKKKETATTLAESKQRQEQKALEQLRRKKSEEADRILTLQLAAKEMERIIAQLEKERRQRAFSDRGRQSIPSAFALQKGQLISPFKGKVVVSFGHAEDPITKLKSFSPGITIKGKAGGGIVAVADGTVVYAGHLRGYGNFVIINHDDQYYTTYSGLEKMLVKTNEYVWAGMTLGLAGADGLVKFELRRGREPLDPVEWISIDSF
ncbi:MAG: murein hydrolase activator EnvC family protein [Candidatus Zixiibacteriota bacterium]